MDVIIFYSWYFEEYKLKILVQFIVMLRKRRNNWNIKIKFILEDERGMIVERGKFFCN